MAQAAALATDKATGFVRGLGLLDSTMIVAGSMIGSGIFIVSADIARQVGSAGWLILVWVVTGLLTVAAALSYGELAGMMPQAGGQYVYLREAYSPLWGFLYGWTMFLVIQTGTIAAVTVGFARYLGVLIPAISPKVLTQTVRSLERDGLVSRVQHPEIPPRVEYALTALGRSAGPVLQAIADWWRKHGEAVRSAAARG